MCDVKIIAAVDFSNATSAGELRRAASDALRAQLFDNLLFIARRNQGQPGELSNYFSQHLLEDPAAPADPVESG